MTVNIAHDADRREPGPPVRRLWLNAFLGYVSIGSTIEIMPDYVAHRFSGGAFAASAAVTIGFLATMIARPVAGRLVDLRGARGIVVTGAALAAAGGLAHLLAPDYAGLIAARLLLGLGEGGLFTASISWVLADAPAERRGRISGRFGLSMWGGLTLGPIAGEALRQADGYMAVWLMAALLPVVGGALVATASGRSAVPPKAPGGSPAWFPAAARGAAAAYVFSSLGYGVIAACLVPRLSALGLADSRSGLAVFGASFLAARFLGSAFVDRIGPRRMLCVALLTEAIGLAGLGFAVWAAWGAVVLAGIGIALVYPCYIAVVTAAARPGERAAALGTVISAWDLGVAAGGVLGGCLPGDHYLGAFAAAALCALVSMAVGLVWRLGVNAPAPQSPAGSS